MTLDPLSSASRALSSLPGVSPTAGAVAAAGARSLALGVASEVGKHLLATLSGLVPSGQGAPQTPEARAYDIAALAEVLGQSVGAGPIETVAIERGLEDLAGAVAADLAGLADGHTLDRLDAALAAQDAASGDDTATATEVSDRLHAIAAHIAASF